MTKQRNIALDWLRILACFMVVLMHSPIPSADANGAFLSAMSYATAPCIGLFFMVSGALLLPVRTDYITFLRKRFSKIVVPTLLWSLIYIGLNIYNSQSEINLLQLFASMPFTNQGSGVLWFMYTLAGLYLLAPLLSGWLEQASKRDIQLVLSLWAITLCYPLLNLVGITTNPSTTGILYYFGGYAGYFLLGYYLRRFPTAISGFLCFGIAIAGVGLLLVLKRFNIPFDFYQLFWYESIFIAALAAGVWKAVVRICKTLKYSELAGGGICALLSNLSFGIYLIHILIMRHWLWRQTWILNISDYSLQCLIIAALTMVLSAVICLLIAWLPGAQWIIGYRNRKIARD